MINQFEILQKQVFLKKHPSIRKTLGQYFTDSTVARFMSFQIEIEKLNRQDIIRVLDCGAGLGMLTVSTSLFLLENGFKNIHVDLYEIDQSVISKLESNINLIKREFENVQGNFTYTIFTKDFVVERPDLNLGYKFNPDSADLQSVPT